MPKTKISLGDRDGRLVVLEKLYNDLNQLMVRCRCDCGTETTIRSCQFVTGSTQSCGCLRRDVTIKKNRVHGQSVRGSRTSEYSIWAAMIQRCTNPNDKSYRDYGGRGIAVCERWMSFEHFIADMGVRPSVSHSIDRIDNNDGYRPENCRWATSGQQSRNRRNNVWITFNGMSRVLQDWATDLGINRETLYERIFLRSWPLGKALTTPPRKRQRLKDA